jgi:hypothetical protein
MLFEGVPGWSGRCVLGGTVEPGFQLGVRLGMRGGGVSLSIVGIGRCKRALLLSSEGMEGGV